MKLSIMVAIITMGFWLGQFLYANKEGTLIREQGRVQMSFLRNWAVSAGIPSIFLYLNLIILDNIEITTGRFEFLKYLVYLFFGGIISYFLHRLWWGHDENLGHVFPSWEASGRDSIFWMRDISKAGWIHFVFVGFQAAILIWYVFSSMPSGIVILVGIFLGVFVVLQTIQAQVIQSGANLKLFFLEMAGITLVTVIKL